MFYLEIQKRPRVFTQGEILRHFLDFKEKFLSKYWIFQYVLYILTLKAAIRTAADDIYKNSYYCFSEKIRFDISSESSAGQRIHLKKSSLIFFE